MEGPAGTGKTFRLIQMLVSSLAVRPLQDGQRILALTFMHGARRRLADRLRSVAGVGERFECTTVDSFAMRICHRWRSLATHHGILVPDERSFDEVCAAAASLLEDRQVAAWTAASFPIVLVDEGQDLSVERVRIVAALSETADVIVAADEFQCLNQTLRPNPFVGWLAAHSMVERLEQVHRTANGGLLAAALSIRTGRAPLSGGGFHVLPPGHSAPLAATLVASTIAWNRAEHVAVITPALAGGFAESVVKRIGEAPCGKRRVGPYRIVWEGTDRAEADAVIEALALPGSASATTLLKLLRAHSESAPVRATMHWVDHQLRAVGRETFSRSEVESQIRRRVTLRRQYATGAEQRLAAMTVQQAKNREFDGVVVLWPYTVGGDDEHKRRLLYNAVTRAKSWCKVIAQSPRILASTPFA